MSTEKKSLKPTLQTSRRGSRIVVFKIIFMYIMRYEKVSWEKCSKYIISNTDFHRHNKDFTDNLLKLIKSHLTEAKVILKVYSPNLPYDRILFTTKAILLLGIIEIKYLETPPVVVINEYIEIAKEFSEEKSLGFINGVLDKFHKNIG